MTLISIVSLSCVELFDSMIVVVELIISMRMKVSMMSLVAMQSFDHIRQTHYHYQYPLYKFVEL